MKTQRTAQKIWVQWRGRLYGLPLVTGRKSRSSDTGASDLVAPFSCKVLRVHAAAGQTLKAGDPVVVVEAMKMEYSYASPRDGTVEAVLVKEGEIVPSGAHFLKWKQE